MPLNGRKLIFDRIQSTENYFGELCTEMSGFTKKKARLRDRYDELSRIFKNSGESIRFNETLSSGLSNYAKAFTLLGDVKDIEVQRLQSKIIRELASYESICKNARDALKHSLLMQGKEIARRHHMHQVKQKNQRQNEHATNDEQNPAPNEDNDPMQDFEVKALNFERQKITDIRQILMDFTLIQLKECAKSMEILTAVYSDIAAINIESDLDDFGQKCFNRNQLDASNRSQSLNALNTNTTNALNRSKLSNSTFALSSPNKHQANEDTESKVSDEQSSNEMASSNSDDETSTITSNQTTKQSSSDDDDVEIRPAKSLRTTRDSIQGQEKRNAPVPQVRFSKQNNNRI